jgi:hypothetical protein
MIFAADQGVQDIDEPLVMEAMATTVGSDFTEGIEGAV